MSTAMATISHILLPTAYKNSAHRPDSSSTSFTLYFCFALLEAKVGVFVLPPPFSLAALRLLTAG